MTCFRYLLTNTLFLTGQWSSFVMFAISFPLSLFSLPSVCGYCVECAVGSVTAWNVLGVRLLRGMCWESGWLFGPSAVIGLNLARCVIM